jgi:hypothetical protein
VIKINSLVMIKKLCVGLRAVNKKKKKKKNNDDESFFLTFISTAKSNYFSVRLYLRYFPDKQNWMNELPTVTE